ncbi:MAG: hypothetical protein Q8930_18330 [Bacillota bacterium]|nr:hypothetical protein [Bacillota bacterium]
MEVDTMGQPQIRRMQDYEYKDNDNFNFTPEIIEEIKVALKESKEGKVVPNENFEEYFCK